MCSGTRTSRLRCRGGWSTFRKGGGGGVCAGDRGTGQRMKRGVGGDDGWWSANYLMVIHAAGLGLSCLPGTGIKLRKLPNLGPPPPAIPRV